MKNIFLVLLLSAISATGFAQDFTNIDFGFNSVAVEQELAYNVRGAYKRPLLKERVVNAKLIGDFVDGYPSNWITDYVSVEIIATENGKQVKTESSNEVLTAAQKNMLSSVKVGTEVQIVVNYIYENTAMKKREDKQINLALTIVPEKEAEYIGGYEKMIEYLKENSKDKIPTKLFSDMQMAEIRFTVNEKGEVCNPSIHTSSGDQETDKVLLELINNMPDWNPARDLHGNAVEQEFQFGIGKGGARPITG